MGLFVETHPNDDMFTGSYEHYERCGKELANYAQEAKLSLKRENLKVLELPCGYGRVTRHLVNIFDSHQLTSADVMKDAVDFVSNKFLVNGFVVSEPANEFRGLPENEFDIGLMGSLITHFSEENSRIILSKFLSKIKNDGIAIITTHGHRSYEMLVNKDWFEITDDDYETLKKSYESINYGFVSYASEHTFEKKTVEEVGNSYGISLIPKSWMEDTITGMGYKIIKFYPAGWDNHQDVYFINKK